MQRKARDGEAMVGRQSEREEPGPQAGAIQAYPL